MGKPSYVSVPLCLKLIQLTLRQLDISTESTRQATDYVSPIHHTYLEIKLVGCFISVVIYYRLD